MFEQKLKSIMEQIGATLSNKNADNSLITPLTPILSLCLV